MKRLRVWHDRVHQEIFPYRELGAVTTGVLLALLLNGCSGKATDFNKVDPIQAAWVVIGKDDTAVARVITTDTACPTITNGSRQIRMSLRAPSATEPLRKTASDPAYSKPSAFPVTTCEYTIPAGSTALSVGEHKLPLPKSAPQRIVADTGCRLKKADNAWQSCNDPSAWPFPQLVKVAAAMQPDLVLHIGDYHYRENACPEGDNGCASSPWGYGWDTWQADFFQPTAPLLQVAPWVMVRGNHEECARAGQGWFRFLDSQPLTDQRSCNDAANDKLADYTDPYAVALGNDTQFIVFDSAKVNKMPLATTDSQFKIYMAQFQKVSQLAAKARVNSIFTNHHPILGYTVKPDGTPTKGNPNLQSVMRSVNSTAYYPEGVKTAIHGHVHDFQAISFASNHPATFVSGNAGDALEVPLIDPFPMSVSPAEGATIDQIAKHDHFGFMVMDRQRDDSWLYTAYTATGEKLTACRQDGSKINCDRTGNVGLH